MKYFNLFHLIKVIPRWTVLQIDIITCIFSFLIAYALRFNFEWEEIIWSEFLALLACIIGSKIIFFLVTQSYAGIIRYTSVEDALRIFQALTFNLLVFLRLMAFTSISLIPTSFRFPSSLLTTACQCWEWEPSGYW